MNLAFKPDISKIKKLQASRPLVEVEFDDSETPSQNRRGKYRKWTNKEVQAIEELLMLGLSHNTIARKLNVGVLAMQRKLHTSGIHRHVNAKRKKLIQDVMDKLNND